MAAPKDTRQKDLFRPALDSIIDLNQQAKRNYPQLLAGPFRMARQDS